MTQLSVVLGIIYGWNSRDKAHALVLTSQKEQGFAKSLASSNTVPTDNCC